MFMIVKYNIPIDFYAPAKGRYFLDRLYTYICNGKNTLKSVLIT